MERMIETRTWISITDNDGKPLLARSLLEKGDKVCHNEDTGMFDLVSKQGQTTWHSRIPQDAKIEYEVDSDNWNQDHEVEE